MSSMLKLLSVLILSISLLNANEDFAKVENFLTNLYKSNPNLRSLKVKVLDTMEVDRVSGWSAYVVQMDAILEKDQRQVLEKMVWFSDGDVITKEVFDRKSGRNLSEFVKFEFKDEYYKKENLIYGSEKSRNKVVIFSDPLCPFCKQIVPEALEYMSKDPSRYAVYYYHLPLENLHPASVEIVQAAIALELQGRKDVIKDLYKIKINPAEQSNEVVLGVFNKIMNAKIGMVEVMSQEVNDRLKADLKVVDELLVNGTPTIFVNGMIDRSKTKYKEVK